MIHTKNMQNVEVYYYDYKKQTQADGTKKSVIVKKTSVDVGYNTRIEVFVNSIMVYETPAIDMEDDVDEGIE